jgi:beta-phosphoglucomutase family hydrolase
VDWSAYRAVLADLDGVLTPTVDVHRRAWRALLAPWFDAQHLAPYRDEDYLAHIDGKPRLEGLRAALASRGVRLPEGDPDDAPGDPTLHGLGARKDALVREILAAGVAPYPGSVRLLDRLTAAGIPVAVVSSSRNTRAVLDAAGLTGRVAVVVDGQRAAADRLAGKPAPDTFLAAAVDLGVAPAGCVVLEDAVSGVAAGRAAQAGLVVGVDRGAGRDALTAAGADLVVRDLAELCA